MQIKTKKYNIFLILAFFLILTIPTLDLFFKISPIKELFENRILKTKPENPKTIAEFKNYPKNFEEYFSDNYGFRKSLISFNGKIQDKIFNVSPSARAFFGKDNWLFFDNKNSILDFTGLATIDENKIQIAANSFIKNWQKLQKENIQYVLVIAADKSLIYPEFMPDFIKYNSKNHRIDKFLKILQEKSPNFPVIDLRKKMLEAKKNEIIYHKTDTHWNRRGAHYGYETIMKKLNLKYQSRKNFFEISENFYKGDISNIMNLELRNIDFDLKPKFQKKYKLGKIDENYSKKFHKLTFFTNKNKDLPILFVYKDSFFDNMQEFFAQNFSKSYFINEFPCEIDMKIIKEFKPNVVIQQFWEARIEDVVNQCKP